MQPKFSSFETPRPEKLKDELGWWNHGESADFSELVSAVMQLCNMISKQQIEIETLKNLITIGGQNAA